MVLFRSDSFRLDFDVQGGRVHSYDPDGDPAEARRVVRDTVAESLRTLDTAQRVAISYAAQRLTPVALNLLMLGMQKKEIPDPSRKSIRDAVGVIHHDRAIELLLELAALAAQPLQLTMEHFEKVESNPNQAAERWLRYAVTPFGGALLAHVVKAVLPPIGRHLKIQ